jgi:DNA (cytosine-5)-methyltransferase 1
VGPAGRGRWAPEPGVGRVAHGVPARVDRLRGLGNAVVPQVAECIGRMIMEAAS